MDLPDLARLLPEIRALARAAGRAILAHYESPPVPTRKADGSPVTQADYDADAIIAPGLAALTPDIPIVSEESRHGDAQGARGFWLVDPLDGTRDFIARTGEFTVNIGLVWDGEPVLGVMHVPVGDLVYAATMPGGAVVARGDGRDSPMRVRSTPAAGMTVVQSRFRGRTEGVDEFLAGFKVHEIVQRGSAVKFCDVAAGLADLYPCFGPSYEWDTAAGHAIVRAAGGRVELPDGSKLAYGKPDYLNGPFVAWGGGAAGA
jgi:3'(2'), 5'-bisphosphate nucleotidase